MVNKNLLTVLVYILAFVLSACGGGSSSGTSQAGNNVPESTTPPTSAPTPSPTVLKGSFVDSPVSGLKFETSTQSGTTDNEGMFSFIENEQITFSIGDITFPTVASMSVITPLDIFNTNDVYSKEVVNMIRLLQTLDIDGNAENGIEIPDSVHALAKGTTVDFSSDNFATEITFLVENTISVYQQLISAEQAIAHFQQTLYILAGNPPVACGNDHPKVGFTGNFQTYAHNVAGTAIIIDNCTIEISNFDYDGRGPTVYFYADLINDYTTGSAYAIGDKINGQVYDNATIILTLPETRTLDSIEWLSVWCSDFNANFGEVMFGPP